MNDVVHKYRSRGVDLPSLAVINGCQDEEIVRRLVLLSRLSATLFDYWRQFASGQLSSVPDHSEPEAMYKEFLHCHCLFLWRFKTKRKSDDEVVRYAYGVRALVWDKNMALWRAVSNCYAGVFGDNFYEELCKLAHAVGMLSREMELFANNQMNAAEYVIHQRNSTRKGADKTHREHRALKAEVFKWLDENMSGYRSMDAAATVVAREVVPVAWRTARDWIGDWRKLRSAGKA